MPDSVYLDACCVNRPFDDQTQDRIRLESEAVLLILAHVESGEWDWLGSQALDAEVAQTPDLARRVRVQTLLSAAGRSVVVDEVVVQRAEELAAWGIGSLDALHLACAEAGGAAVFLTTDDRLQRRAHRLSARLRVRVANPLDWLREVTTA